MPVEILTFQGQGERKHQSLAGQICWLVIIQSGLNTVKMGKVYLKKKHQKVK